MTPAQPGWLILLILIPLIGVLAVVIARLRRRQWEPFVASRLRGALVRTASSVPRWMALVFLLAASTALIGTLARPQGDLGTTSESVTGRNILIALDISRSMLVDDVKPDRLSQAKVVIYELLEALPNDRIGLIGFAGSADLFAPLTIDHSAVRETVEQMTPDWARLGGSDLSAALKLATSTLRETGQKNNALVFISDGEHHESDLIPMIREAESSGVYIFAIGVGTEDGGFVPSPDFPGRHMTDRSGREILSRLDADVMRKLATETGGRYAVAGSAMDIPAMIQAATQDLDAFEIEGRERRVMAEFYQWVLLPGIFFLILSILAGTRWRGMRAVPPAAATCLFLATAPPAEAADPTSARSALAEGRHEEARDVYRQLAESARLDGRAARFRIGEGTAAYRAGDYRGARSAFSQSLLSNDPDVVSNGHLGLGNALFQLGWLGLTGESYPHDPEMLPDLDRFDTIVRERLAQLAEGDAPESGEADGFTRLEALITNWADAARHFDSATEASPADPAGARNRETTLAYLQRLRELMEEEKEETEDTTPQPEPGEAPPQAGEPGDEEGEGEGEPQEGEGPGGRQEGEEGPGEGEEEPEQPGEDGDQPQEPQEGEDPQQEAQDGSGEADPNESPEERARRILAENADLERGPLNPGRREFRDPEKDW
jgi:Ca-activated chloride channel homolog